MSLGPIMLDIEGLQLSPADRDLLLEPAVGGVILFSRNFASPQQLIDLVGDIRALRRPPLLVAVDHEGGRVQRFRDGFTAMPPMREIGQQFDVDPGHARQLAHSAGWLIASELRAADIDLCFAPCIDLDWRVSDIIGDRAFHRQPDTVATLANEFCNGLRSAGMAAIGKHFPGHGAVIADSHLKLPVDRREYSDILDDMHPYERLINNSSLAGVMTAHIVYREVDPLPASFSRFWIQDQLRQRLGFSGAVFCDDLSMKATNSYGTMAERAHLSLEAGCDMLLICNDRPAAKNAVVALREYSNPLSLVRLARLHGTGEILRETLLSSDDWLEANRQLAAYSERPELKLDA